MESGFIISSIRPIYERFNIMPALQMHMKRTAAVAELIFSTNHGLIFHQEDVIAALLLHDLGNIVKFKLAEESDHWKKIQEDTVAKYGANDHEVTKKMLVELGVKERAAFLISEMGFENLSQVINSNDIELKICFYADLRVAPDGVVSLKERFNDLRRRYPFQTRYDPVQEKRALVLETQIFNNFPLNPIDINDQTIASFVKDS